MNKKRSIENHLVRLVLLTVIPVLFLCVALLAHVAADKTRELKANYSASAQSTRVVFDQQIESVISSLAILAEVEDFNPEVVQHFHLRLRRYIESQTVIQSIALTDTKGVQVFNSSESYGKKLPPLKNEDFFQEMLQSGKIKVSGLDPDTKTVSIAVPVKLNDSILYALVATISPETLPSLLQSQKLPKNWFVKVIDSKNNYIATSGEELSNEALDSASIVSLKSKVTGWQFVLEIPIDKNYYVKSLSVFILGGFLLLIVSLMLALHYGKKVSSPLKALSLSAKALGEGKMISPIKTNLVEANDIEDALLIAAAERDENEKMMRLLYEKEQETVKIRDTFLSVASHELKTPITTLKLQLQLLDRTLKKRDSMPRQEMEKPISRLENQVGRLVTLVDDLLDVSRIHAGKISFHYESFDLVPFVVDLASQIEGMAQEAQSPIKISGLSSVMGIWDKHRLEQIMINLMSNAIKYGDGNAIEVIIDSDESNAYINVKDHGIGISEDDQKRIFERFERAVAGNNISGLGLGLWIVKKIVNGLGGDISVQSQIHTGSVFSLKLPLRPHATIAEMNSSAIDFTQTH